MKLSDYFKPAPHNPIEAIIQKVNENRERRIERMQRAEVDLGRKPIRISEFYRRRGVRDRRRKWGG